MIEIGMPPTSDAPVDEHEAYADEVLSKIEEVVQRLETPGLRIDMSWPSGDISMGATAFFCRSCTVLHRKVWLMGEDGHVFADRDASD